jgi:replication factor C subunit 3/5
MTFQSRHRPRSINDLVFADPLVAGVVQLYATQRPSKPLLLYGPPGTGKSEALRLIALAQFAKAGIETQDFVINGGDTYRDLFNTMLNMAQWQFWPAGTPSLIVIDEIDEIEDKHRGKLRSFIEAHPSVQILASTNYFNALSPALKSRMRCVQVLPPTGSDWAARAHAILTAEGASISINVVQGLLKNFTGDSRDLVDYLEELVLMGLSSITPPPAPHSAAISGSPTSSSSSLASPPLPSATTPSPSPQPQTP